MGVCKHACARRITNAESVDQILLSIKQRLKRKRVKLPIRHDCQSVSRQHVLNRCDELVVEGLQVCLARLDQRRLEARHVGWLKTKLRQLELQHPKRLRNVG